MLGHNAYGTAQAMHVIRGWGGSAPPHPPEWIALDVAPPSNEMHGLVQCRLSMRVAPPPNGKVSARGGVGGRSPPTSEWHAWTGAVCPCVTVTDPNGLRPESQGAVRTNNANGSYENGFRLQLDALHTGFTLVHTAAVSVEPALVLRC